MLADVTYWQKVQPSPVPTGTPLARQPKLVVLTGRPTVAPAALGWATFACTHERRLVDLTGIEPVTS